MAFPPTFIAIVMASSVSGVIVPLDLRDRFAFRELRLTLQTRDPKHGAPAYSLGYFVKTKFSAVRAMSDAQFTFTSDNFIETIAAERDRLLKVQSDPLAKATSVETSTGEEEWRDASCAL